MPLPSYSGVTAFIYLHTIIGAARVHRFAWRETFIGTTAKPYPTLSFGYAGFCHKTVPIPMESKTTDGKGWGTALH